MGKPTEAAPMKGNAGEGEIATPAGGAFLQGLPEEVAIPQGFEESRGVILTHGVGEVDSAGSEICGDKVASAQLTTAGRWSPALL